MQSFATRSGIVATVTGEGIVVPTIGNQSWFEYGGRVGYRISKGWIADLFVNGTAGPQPVGNTLHGGVGLADHVLKSGLAPSFETHRFAMLLRMRSCAAPLW